MTELNIPNLGKAGEPLPFDAALRMAQELAVPSAGASVATYMPEDGSIVGHVILAPGSGLTARTRARVIAVHPVVHCTIRSEAEFKWRRPPTAADFHEDTISWMLGRADHVAIWSAPYPELASEVRAASEAAIRRGGKFMVVIECQPDNAAEWVRLVDDLKSKTAVAEVFGPRANASEDSKVQS